MSDAVAYAAPVDTANAGIPFAWSPGVRCVVHVDLDCFYASVETLLNPALQDKPIAVVMGLDARGTGAVTTASYAARAFGVHSAMRMSNALQLCPDLVVLPVRHSLYREYSGRIMTLLRGLSSRIQQVSIDEAFVELQDLDSSWQALLAVRAQILAEIGLPCSFGVAANKLVAKIATGQGKPRGFKVVAPGTERSFLAPLPVGKLWGVGPTSESKLHELGITLLGELAERNPTDLADSFGHRRAMELYRGALGLDDSPLETERTYKSISTEQTLGPDALNRKALWSMIQRMAADVAGRLDGEGLAAKTVGLKMRLDDWKLVTRDRTLPAPTTDPVKIAWTAGDLMRENWQPGVRIRLFGLRVSSLGPRPAASQLPLFDTGIANQNSASSHADR
jgi:DNA polymerase-4